MFRFKITPEDGNPYELVASSRDVLQWERRNKGASMSRLQAEMRMTDVYKIAYFAATRQNGYPGTEADFTDEVDLELLDDEEEDEEVPTNTAVSAGA